MKLPLAAENSASFPVLVVTAVYTPPAGSLGRTEERKTTGLWLCKAAVLVSSVTPAPNAPGNVMTFSAVLL